VSRLEKRLQEVWYGGRKPNLVLRGLAVLYGAIVQLRSAAYRRGWLRRHRVGAPVIVVGNLTAGGSGKTPLVIALVEHLCRNGWSPGVVSRGHGRGSRGQVEVGVDTSPERGGDEPVLIARRTGVPVVVDADRVAAARRAVALGCDIVVADDGLQHERLHRDIEVEVIDEVRRYGNGRLLPAGPLREFGRPGTDLYVSHRDRHTEIGRASPGFVLKGEALHAHDGRIETLASWRDRRVHAVAGIGHPRRFFDRLREEGLKVVEHAFPDHHAYAAADLYFSERLPVVMTEKDWVKCASIAPADAWYLPVRAECSPSVFEAIDRLLSLKIGNRHG
jgi:tetraacyldisaccharide 4'-kinase